MGQYIILQLSIFQFLYILLWYSNTPVYSNHFKWIHMHVQGITFLETYDKSLYNVKPKLLLIILYYNFAIFSIDIMCCLFTAFPPGRNPCKKAAARSRQPLLPSIVFCLLTDFLFALRR